MLATYKTMIHPVIHTLERHCHVNTLVCVEKALDKVQNLFMIKKKAQLSGVGLEKRLWILM